VVLAREPECKLVQACPADDNGAGMFETTDDGCRVVGNLAVERGTGGRGESLLVDEVFDGYRHTGQQPEFLTCLVSIVDGSGGSQRSFPVDQHEGIEFRCLSPAKVVFNYLETGSLAKSDRLGQSYCRFVMDHSRLKTRNESGGSDLGVHRVSPSA
jgi:hypothetical protein